MRKEKMTGLTIRWFLIRGSYCFLLMLPRPFLSLAALIL